MKLGAHDFVRKPMTPEMLRNAVAAVLASAKRLQPETTSSPVSNSIKTITMNGFTILDEDRASGESADQQTFTIVSPTKLQETVVVQVTQQVVEYIHRMTQKYLPFESSFWTEEARRLLADYLWFNGSLPASKRLILQEIDRDKLLAAERWMD